MREYDLGLGKLFFQTMRDSFGTIYGTVLSACATKPYLKGIKTTRKITFHARTDN